MLAFCTSQSEISVVLGLSDAKWLSDEMSFLAELYRSKAGSSERQFEQRGLSVVLGNGTQMPAAVGRATTGRQSRSARGGRWPRSTHRCFASHRSAASSFGFSQSRNLVRLGRTPDPAKARAANG